MELAKKFQHTMQEKPSVRHKLLSFIEHPLFTLPIGILGGLVGIAFYAPTLAVCGVCVILAFHRAGVVAEQSLWKVQIPSYVLLVSLVVGGLLWLHVLLQKELVQANVSFSKLVVATLADKYPWLISPPPPPPKLPEPKKQRGYVDIGPFEVGIAGRSFPNDPDAGRFMVNVGCKNVGSIEVTFKSCDAEVFIYEGSEFQALQDRTKQEEFFQSFLRKRKHVPEFPREMIPTRFSQGSYLGPMASTIITTVNSQKEAVVIVGRVTWFDSIKTTNTDLCEVMQAPFTRFPSVAGWHRCLVHEGDQ
jgi:hypothetical protein